MSALIEGKFLAWLNARSVPDSYAFEQGRISSERAQSLFDEFIVQQARIMGTRIFFQPTVLIRLYAWSQDVESGAKRWRSFAKNVQNNLDNKPLTITDEWISRAKDDLVADLKVLKTALLARKAAVIAWDLELHANNIDMALQRFNSKILGSNITMFKAFVRGQCCSVYQ
jgi:hypothetical protein